MMRQRNKRIRLWLFGNAHGALDLHIRVATHGAYPVHANDALGRDTDLASLCEVGTAEPGFALDALP